MVKERAIVTEKTKISVIIPVYKVELYLHSCLNSVMNQTYRNLEIIIIDDGSPDNCGKICDYYASMDERIIVIHKRNEGLSAARNQGINMATGEWIAFVDSDDWIELNYYEKLIKTANSLKKQADVVCASGHIKEGKQSRILYSFHGESGLLENYDSSELMCRVCKATRKDDANLGAPWDKMYRKAFLKNIAVCFEGRAWEDIRFNMVVFTNNPCVAVSDVIGYHYRTVETSIVNNYNSDKPEINYEFIKWLWEYLKLNISDGTKKGKFIAIIQMRAYMAFMNSLKCYYFHSLNHAPYKEIVRQVKKMKALPIYSDMIKRDSRFSYLTVKQNIFRYVLRLPWLFPAKALYALNEKVRLVTEESGKFVRKGGKISAGNSL